MAVTTLDGLVGAINAGETRNFFKPAFTGVIGGFFSQWGLAGYPAAGAAPGNVNGLIPVDSTTGAFQFVNAAANNYLGYVSAASTTAGTLVIYDRLFHSSGLSATTTTPGTALTPAALTRNTNGHGVEVWLEQYGAFTVTSAATLTFDYTDQDGNTAQVGTIAKAAVAGVNGTMYPAQLAVGDYGVRAVTNYFWSATQTAGTWGFTMMKRVCTIPLQTNNKPEIFDAISTGIREVPDDACLAFMIQCSTPSMGIISGELTIAKG